MKIRGWFIDGFGVFHNAKVENLPDGLTIFVGPNEAGKSTLLGFLRGMLFGFPKGNSSEPKYPPLRGGKHGGRVFLSADGQGGEIVVTRYAGTKSLAAISLPGGVGGNEEDLSNLLGRADKDVFQNIFAFSLSELESLKVLRESGVGEMVFSAGVTGAGQSARAVCESLSEQARAILASRGKNTKVMQLVEQLEQLQADCREATDKTREYSELVQREAKARQNVGELRDAQGRASGTISRMTLLAELWPAWNLMQSLRRQLEQGEAVDEFPPDGERRLMQAQASLAAAREKLRELQAAAENRATERNELQAKLDDLLQPCADAVDVQFANLNLHQERLNQRPGLEQKLAQCRQELEETLRDLGPGWTAQRAGTVDTSVPRTGEIRQWKDRIAAAGATLAEAMRDQAAGAAAKKAVQDDHDRLARQLTSAPADERALAAQEDSLAQLAALTATLKNQRTRFDALQQGGSDRRQGVEQSPPLMRGIYIISGAVALVGAAFAGYLLVVGKTTAGVVMAGVFAVLAVAGAIAGRRVAGSVTGLTAVREAIVKSGEDLARLGQEIEQSKLAIASLAGSLGLPAAPTDQDVQLRTRRLRDEQKALMLWMVESKRLAELKDKLLGLQGDCRDRQAQAELAQAAANSVTNQWQAWKQQAGVPESLDPDGVLTFLSKVESARAQIRAVASVETQLRQLQEQVDAWHAQSRTLLSRAGRAPAQGASDRAIAEALVGLHRACQEDCQLRKTLATLDKELQAGQAALDNAQRRQVELRQQVDAIFAEAGVADEAGFRRKLAAFENRRDIRAAIDAKELTLAERLGQGEDARKIREELADGHVAQWEEARLAAQQELEKTRQAFEDAIRAEDAAAKARQAMEESVDVPNLELRMETLRRQLAQALNEWQVKTVAGALVDSTLQRFVRTRQPAVLAQAGKAMQSVTGGAYQSIEQTADGGMSFEVVDGDRGRKSPEQLSRGTAEQLYLCLRLGLAAEFARKRTGLPMVVDDVLVNFDPARAKAMAGVIAEFASHGQVLLFTCHPQTVETFRSVCPGVHVERLAGEGIGPE